MNSEQINPGEIPAAVLETYAMAGQLWGQLIPIVALQLQAVPVEQLPTFWRALLSNIAGSMEAAIGHATAQAVLVDIGEQAADSAPVQLPPLH